MVIFPSTDLMCSGVSLLFCQNVNKFIDRKREVLLWYISLHTKPAGNNIFVQLIVICVNIMFYLT